MKKVFAVLAVCLLLTGCSKTVPKMKDGSEAIVTFESGKNISANKLYKVLKDAYGTEKIVDLMDKQILMAKYPKKMDAAEKSAEENLKSIKEYYKDENGNYNEDGLLSAIKQYYGYNSIDEFKESLKVNYLRNLAVTEYAKTKITEKEQNAYYKDEIVGDRKVYHIQIVPKVKDSMKDSEKEAAEKKALQKAKDAIARLKKGEKFSAVAKDVSSDDSTKDKGGDLGYINKGDYGSTEFDDEVWSLELGTYSKTPVKTSKGYEIVYVTKEKAKKSFDKVQKKIIKTLAEELVSKDADVQISAMENYRKEAGIKITDDDLNKSYKKYMRTLHENAIAQNNQKQSSDEK